MASEESMDDDRGFQHNVSEHGTAPTGTNEE
jgi:hypothetical protein